MTHKPYEPPLIIARVDVVAAFPHLYMRHQAFLDPRPLRHWVSSSMNTARSTLPLLKAWASAQK